MKKKETEIEKKGSSSETRVKEESLEHNDRQDIEYDISMIVETRFNVVTTQVEYRSKEEKSFTPMTDYVEKSILRALRAKNYKIGTTTIRNILCSSFSPRYNPFTEFFESLPTWDEETNPIEDFCNLVQVENDRYWKEWFTKWIVGLVACAIDERVANHQVLVLTGGQGIGKTTWLQHIVPKKLSKYTNSGYVNPDGKDAQIQCSECILINIDELSSLGNKSLEAFKQMVTQHTFRVRKPYGFNAETLVKRASFCGSTNEDQFLIDLTGNRRFLCFKALDVDLDAVADFNIDLVFAQAYTMYMDDFEYFFSKSENKLIEQANQDFVVRSLEEEAIEERFVPCGRDEDGLGVYKWTATQVMDSLSNTCSIYKTQATAQRIGKALTRLGFHKSKSNGKMIYRLRMR